MRSAPRGALDPGGLEGPVDGIFGPLTADATRRFQRRARLAVDAVVGPQTYGAALQGGFDPGFVDPHGGTAGADWPPLPGFSPLVSNAERAEVFGRFRYERKRCALRPGNVTAPTAGARCWTRW
jgi:peptidoglycan hydrolase-like protein with peptidoglycan-binding domain